jgi:hypothetical protein
MVIECHQLQKNQETWDEANQLFGHLHDKNWCYL